MSKRKRNTMLITIIFYLYIILLSYFLFFSEYLNRGEIAQDYQINTELFREIKRYCTQWRVLGIKRFLINIPGNIIAFVPFGFFLPYLKKFYRKFLLVSFLSFLFSLIIETIQLKTRVGSFDVDDILLNTIGGMLGYLCYKIFIAVRKRMNKGEDYKGEVDD